MKHAHSTSSLFWAGALVIGMMVLLVSLFFMFSSSSPEPLQAIDSGCVSADRSAYGVSLDVFSKLPPLPSCIRSASSAFASGTFTDVFFFSSDFYLQPEFYPSFFTDGLGKYSSPTPTHYGAVGYGAFPHSIRRELLPSVSVKERIFFHSGFGVRSYQGGHLRVEYAIPEDAGHVQVVLDPSSSSDFLLGPAYPVFSPLWVRPVDLTITMGPGSPYRDVIIYLVTDAPSGEFMEAQQSLYSGIFNSFTDYVGSQRVATLVLRRV